MLTRSVAVSALVLSLAACGGSGTSGSTTTTVVSSFSNACESTLTKFAVDLLVSRGDMEPVKAEWPDNANVQDLLETAYLIGKPLVEKDSLGPAVNYINQVIVNSCRDNDVFNWVQKLGTGSPGYHGNCLDGKLPVDIAKVEPCAADATPVTTTVP